MNTNKLKDLVKKAMNELSWTVLEESKASGPLHIFTNPLARTHTIYRPEEVSVEGAERELLVLHELGHALLCERVHPFFSNGFPIAGLDPDMIPAVTPVLNTASDWFVGHWMMGFCRDEAIAALSREYDLTARMLDKGWSPNFNEFFVAVLIIAQSIKYLNAPAACEGILDAAVKAFLAVPPENPSLDRIEALINALLALGSPLQCRRISREDMEILEFYRPA